jgi:hypothetical protein
MANELIERLEGQGTGYTVMAKRIDPDEHPAMEHVGYSSPTTIFTVWTDGGVAVTSHDAYQVVRDLDGDDDWLLDDLQAMDDALRAADDQPEVEEDAGNLFMDLARYYHTQTRKAQDSAQTAETDSGGAVHDARAGAYSHAATAARETARFARGERDDTPTAVVVGEATMADDAGTDD